MVIHAQVFREVSAELLDNAAALQSLEGAGEYTSKLIYIVPHWQLAGGFYSSESGPLHGLPKCLCNRQLASPRVSDPRERKPMTEQDSVQDESRVL